MAGTNRTKRGANELRRRRGHDELDDNLILWRRRAKAGRSGGKRGRGSHGPETLSKLPETYRLPLILYYREGKSVKAVAEALELSEDAVKQRLARGRDMMQERMSGLIETVLGRTRPNAVFTIAVAVAIGALAVPAAVASAAFTAALTGTSTATGSTASALTFMSTSKALLIAAAQSPRRRCLHSDRVSSGAQASSAGFCEGTDRKLRHRKLKAPARRRTLRTARYLRNGANCTRSMGRTRKQCLSFTKQSQD